jgi:1,4-alpha-glucan branching enzyme
MTESFLSGYDIHLLSEGTLARGYRALGAHLHQENGTSGVRFAVWAPNAARVAVVGDFNDWSGTRHAMRTFGAQGVWECFVPNLGEGALYKYRIESRDGRYRADKADPYGFAAQLRPATASRVVSLDGYQWGDGAWQTARVAGQLHRQPMSTYEVHLGSWRRRSEERDRWLSYREMAAELPDYLHDMGFTHVEFLPLSEHPFDGSWGYQTTGYFAATSRFGEPKDLMYLIDTLHQRGIGVILDWVPAHFPHDEHGLGYFDGTHLYEHADPRQGHHPEWDTYIFNYGRSEVRSFLLSNALFWFDLYHIDALRVDAVASMLYLDYNRSDQGWVRNRFGGRENLEAIDFLHRLNEVVYAEYPGATVIAEESTAWPMVSRPTYLGGLGFGFKWNLGWMHDMLDYMAKDPVYRRYHHQLITFSLTYAFSENYILPFSHDEVVHLKGSMIGRMPGDEWQKFANLRLLYGFQFGHPGKKLLFMGDEFGQWREWNHDQSLDWHLLAGKFHQGLQRWVRDLNTLYRGEPALHRLDCEQAGFEWVDCNDVAWSVVTFIRRGGPGTTPFLFGCNFTPAPRHNYRIGVPTGGYWREVLNSDASLYGGSGQGNFGGVEAAPLPLHGRPYSLTVTLPPLAIVGFKAPGPEPTG